MSEKIFGWIAGISAVVFILLGLGIFTTDQASTPAVTQENIVDSEYVKARGTSECTYDCSGHSAGYEWAEDNNVCDVDYDGGNSESFAEGVRAYAEDECYYDEYYSDGEYER